MAKSEEELNSLLMKVKEESEKSGLKLNFKTLRLWHPVPSLHGQKKGAKAEAVTDLIFLGSKITTDDDCSHKIKRRLLLGGKAVINLDSILKCGDITLLTEVHRVKAVVFPVVTCRCESWTIRRLSTKELMLLNYGAGEVCWIEKRSNQSILKEINPLFIGRTDTEAEAPIF